jgi:hypothetical protein
MRAFLRVSAKASAFAALAALGICWAAPAALAEARTTRIETRPFYGATVTLEEGVRVFRPLPRHDRVIINPGGKTPLSLEFNESNNNFFNNGAGDNVTNNFGGGSGTADIGTFDRFRHARGHRAFRQFGQGHRGHFRR